jgi:hypothetical protein
MFSLEFKNTLAKLIILIWIAFLILIAAWVARISVEFNINTVFTIPGDQAFGLNIVAEVQVILLMLSVSIIGGVAFMIKDFYRSVKYANLYAVAYNDYRAGQMRLAEFQRLVTVEIYTGRFNYTWIYWFLIQPILSSTLGLIAFFIARSGLGLLQGANAAGPELTIQSIYLYAVFTFLAGFSSHKFIAWLDRLADKIFSTTIPERTQEQRSAVAAAAHSDRSELRKSVEPTTTEMVQVFASESESAKMVQEIPQIDRSATGFKQEKLEDLHPQFLDADLDIAVPGMKTIR